MNTEPFRIENESQARKYVNQDDGHCIWLIKHDGEIIMGQPVLIMKDDDHQIWFVPEGQIDAFLATHA